jgi:hypothetical protein
MLALLGDASLSFGCFDGSYPLLATPLRSFQQGQTASCKRVIGLIVNTPPRSETKGVTPPHSGVAHTVLRLRA